MCKLYIVSAKGKTEHVTIQNYILSLNKVQTFKSK